MKDEDVYIRKSSCKQCKNIFRVSVVHMMDAKSKARFNREVTKYDLLVNDIPLLEYRKTAASDMKWCECKS
jgi:hypothetical protein